MFPITFADGTPAVVDGDPASGAPVVVLLHGLNGTAGDMTAPLTARPGLAFNRAGVPVVYRDEGWHTTPPTVPVAGFRSDPPLTAVASWRDALNAAGFATISYTQVAPSGPIAPNIAQLNSAVAGPLTLHDKLRDKRIAFVGHSRGGVLARAFLAAAAPVPAMAEFLGRVTDVITLHSPHQGSGVASLAVTIDSLAAQVQTILGTIGIGAVGVLSFLRSIAGTPGIAELTPGSPFLVATNNTGPVAAVAYHTFGGTSTGAVGIWADTYTPDSGLPLPVPFPVFHWGSVPIRLGVVPDAVSFGPVALLAPTPEILTLASLVATLAATTPELAAGFGDVLVTDTSSRLPFAASHTTNPLNHAEALYDRGLQAQVVALLARRRTTQSGRADVRLTPFPASLAPAPHTVTATDAATGMPITAGLVSVYDVDGNLALQQAVGAPFTYGFAPIRTRVRDPETRQWITEVRGPSIDVTLPAPYGALVVVTGRA